MGVRQTRPSDAGGVPSRPTGDSRKRRDWTPTILLAPAIAYMTVVGFYPLVYSIYISLTNSTAFSPTDTMPLTARAKGLFAAQSLVSLTTIAVVGARAVNILS